MEVFDKYSVLKKITEASQNIPTPTDKDHPAHWWNSGFGKKIKNEFERAFSNLFDDVERLL